MERLTERDSQGNKLVLKNSVECTTENIKKMERKRICNRLYNDKGRSG